MTAININDTTLHYLERGEGEPVALVHGSASDYRTWNAQLDSLSSEFRTVAYSRRYHWPNRPITAEADYPMSEQVDDLESLLRSLDMAPAHLVGHSYGAFLSLLLAIRDPSLVRSLVLAEPPILTLFTSSRPRTTELFKTLVTRPRTALAIVRFGAAGLIPAGRALDRGDTERALRYFGSAVLGRNTFRRLSAQRLEQVRSNFIPAEIVGSGYAPLRAEDVRTLRIPALLITGQHSPRLFHRFNDRLAQLLPHTEQVLIPLASHIMHEDNREAYDSAVLSFLRSHRDADRLMQRSRDNQGWS